MFDFNMESTWFVTETLMVINLLVIKLGIIVCCTENTWKTPVVTGVVHRFYPNGNIQDGCSLSGSI